MRLKTNAERIHIESRDELEQVVNEIAAITNNERKLKADLDSGILKLKERYDAALAKCNAERGPRVEACRVWAEEHPSEFAGKKSLDCLAGIIGWRIGMPQLKTIARNTWATVLDTLQNMGRSDFVRVKQEVDKDAILAQRDSIPEATMKQFGVRVIQEESFFVEPKLSDTEKRLHESN